MLVIGCTPEQLEGLRPAWLSCVEAVGLSGNGHAFDVQDASAAATYVSKFGAAEEIALNTAKKGRSGSRTPWQLLSDASEGDKRAGALFREYADAFMGRRQLVWSSGLKAAASIAEMSDEQASEFRYDPDEFFVVCHWSRKDWIAVRDAVIADLEQLAALRVTGKCQEPPPPRPPD